MTARLHTSFRRTERRQNFLSRRKKISKGAFLSTTTSIQNGRSPKGDIVAFKSKKDNDDHVTDENDGNRINTPLYVSPLRKRGVFIDADVKQAMQQELDNLPLPATLASVCIALSSSVDVLNVFADAAYDLDDDNQTKSLEILGSHLNDMSLSSPTQRREKRKNLFQTACQSLVASGSSKMLETWNDVQQSLSEVFRFTVIDVKQVTDDESPHPPKLSPMKSTATMSSSPKKGTEKLGKSIPKSAQGLSRSVKSQILKGAKLAVSTSYLQFDAYLDRIKSRMGAERFEQIFQHGNFITQSKPPTSTYDIEKAKLDEQIQQKESERRSSILEAEILAAKEKADREKAAKESAMKLMRVLLPEEQAIVTKALRGIGPPSEILSSHDADSVQRSSMQTLNPGQWLNDEVINYFLKNCLAKRDEMICSKQPGRKRSHFFNSFFVQTMFDDKNNNPDLRGKYNYKNVKRWSKKVPGKDIFNLKYILCPINLDNMHWTSAVIFMEEKRIQYYDSLGGTDMSKLKGLLQYVKDEYKSKNAEDLDTTDWELVGCTKDTPRQRNGFDCGVFTCMFCDFISKDCPLVFNQEHINQCRDRIALSIMKNCAVE